MRAYFDVNVQIGRAVIPAPSQAATPGELLAAMDQASVSKALVWHAAQIRTSPAKTNPMLSDLIADTPRLEGVWSILPPITGEIPAETLFDEMRKAGVRALRAFPVEHAFLLRRTVMGSFLEEIADRRIPLILSPEWGVPLEQVYDLLEEYPTLTTIICDVGIWGMDRKIWPLLDNFPRTFVETGLVSLEAGGLEAGVRRFGAHRYLYGSKFPHRYFEAPMLDLEHADLTEKEKDAIAALNLETLLNEVSL